MKYKVGNKVRVRQWDDMAKEFGESAGSIDTPACSFEENMRLYCGTIVTIKEVKNEEELFKNDDEKNIGRNNKKGLFKNIFNKLNKDIVKEEINKDKDIENNNYKEEKEFLDINLFLMKFLNQMVILLNHI